MVYLDYSATTPVLPEVLDSYNKVTVEYFGNSNSLHSLGIKSQELLNSANKQVAELLNIRENEFVYTSGATMSNNLAIIGAAITYRRYGNRICVSTMEHPSIYGICKYLERIGFIIDYVDVTSEGVIDFEDLKRKVTKDTILVSVCAVNSETGARQPLKTVRQVIRKNNENCIFHSDMTQAIGKVNLAVSDVDLASISGHKIYGPKGIGLLYKNKNVVLTPVIYGSEDGDLNPGTPPLPLIVAFSKSLRLALKDLAKKEETVRKYNEKIIAHLVKYPNIKINTSKYCIPHILNISLMDIKPETFIHALETDEIYVSSNTACSKGKRSEAVMNMYKDERRASTTIRISLSYMTLPSEISEFLESFDRHYNELINLK
jgi:cysteine desulfurase